MTKANPANVPTEAATFLALPAEKRQHIVVVDDALFDQARAAAAPSELDEDALGNLAVFGSFFFGIGAVVLPLAGMAYNEYQKKRATWQPLLLTRTASEHLQLQFPRKHPQNKVLYIENPVVSRLYYPAADFHKFVMLHKLGELNRILKSLGATSLEIRCQDDFAREVSSKLTAPAGMVGGAAVQMGGNTKSSSGVAWKATQKKSKATRRRRPVLPRDLAWYPQEQEWQFFVEEVQQGSLDEFTFKLKHDRDWGVNASLAGAALKAKLELGGTFAEHRATEWGISARFDGAAATPT